MLSRLYADNYKSLVNFEIRFDAINLFLGDNGTGKSTVLELIGKLKSVILGEDAVEEIFPQESLTRWQLSPLQKYEMEARIEIGETERRFVYELSVEHDSKGGGAWIGYERLSVDGNPLIQMKSDEDGSLIHLYGDDHSEGPVYPADASRSAVGSVPSRRDNTLMTVFKTFVDHILVVRAVPSGMTATSLKESKHLLPSLENFVSWYRLISQDQGFAYDLMKEFREIVPGFDSFKFSEKNKEFELSVRFKDAEGRGGALYSFAEISDGQRMQIALYALLYASRTAERPWFLCIDEPENFLALPEIQPWLREIYDICNEGGLQAVLISHHPELINYLLASPPIGHWFEREANRPVRVRKITLEDTGISPAEIVARGWLNV